MLMKSWLLLFGCNLMWALQFTCVKLVQNHVGPLFTVWGPMTLATLMLCPLVMAERKHKPERQPALRKDIILFAMLALLGGVPAQVFSTWAHECRWPAMLLC